MQVQSVTNTQSGVNFKSDSGMEKAKAFVNMDDSQLRLISYASGQDKNKEKKNRSNLLKTFYAIPIVDTLASAILVDKNNKLSDEAVAALRKTKLSTRLKEGAKTANFWIVSLSAIQLYSIIKKSIEAKSPNAKKFNRENPVTALLTDVTTILAGGVLATVGMAKLAQKAIDKHPERLTEGAKEIRKAKILINRSKFNRETLPKIAEQMTKFAEKHPWAAKTGRLALANSVLVLFSISLLQMFSHAKKQRERIETNYKNLKTTQFNVAKILVNNFDQDKKALSSEVADLKEAAKEQKVTKKECVSCKDCSEETAAAETDSQVENEEI